MERDPALKNQQNGRYYNAKTGRYLTPDPIGLRRDINLFVYTANGPINRVDPFGLTSAEIGGGFSFTIPGWHFNTSMSTETCCDVNGKKHKRTIQTTCFGFSLGLAIGRGSGPGRGTISIVRDYKQCKGNAGDSYEYEMGFGFSSALYLGASWSTYAPTTTTFITGLGGALHFWSECKDVVKQDVIIGDCCD